MHEKKKRQNLARQLFEIFYRIVIGTVRAPFATACLIAMSVFTGFLTI